MIHRRFTTIAIAASTVAATIAAATIALSVSLAAPAGGTPAGAVECNQSYSNMNTGLTNVIVKPGDTCTLNDVNVHGLTVDGGTLTADNSELHQGTRINGGTATFNNDAIHDGLDVTGGAVKVDNSTIHGSWTITGGTGLAPSLDQCGNTIFGGLDVEGVHGTSTTAGFGTSASPVWVFGEADGGCAGGLIHGGVVFRGNTNTTLELDGYTVFKGLVDTNNSGLWNEIEGNTVHGDATCQSNNAVLGGTTAINDEGGPNTYTKTNNGCPP